MSYGKIKVFSNDGVINLKNYINFIAVYSSFMCITVQYMEGHDSPQLPIICSYKQFLSPSYPTQYMLFHLCTKIQKTDYSIMLCI